MGYVVNNFNGRLNKLKQERFSNYSCLFDKIVNKYPQLYAKVSGGVLNPMNNRYQSYSYRALQESETDTYLLGGLSKSPVEVQNKSFTTSQSVSFLFIAGINITLCYRRILSFFNKKKN